MEAAAAAASSSILLSFSSPRRSTAATFLRLSTASPRITCSATQQLPLAAPWLLTAEKSSTRRRRSILSLRCSSAAAGSPSAVASSERWILEPAGDGDWKHIGYRVARPGAIEIASVPMTVGRVPENADVVIPVATVSGVHARLEKKDGNLVVTDMDSTNGTYVNERKLVPGFPVAVQPGSLLIFGDIHLAMFRVRKTIVDVPAEATKDDQQEAKTVLASAVQETS
uniref:FHA domain-containing protein n=1 Tax=Aegilops tauschii subsp. strangulata TaxID=200361 RepID=A0A453HQ58_AEGTS